MRNKKKFDTQYSSVKKDLNQKISTAIFTFLDENNLPDNTLSRILDKEFHTTLNSGEISKYRNNPEENMIPAMVVIAFCKHFSIPVERLLQDTARSDDVATLRESPLPPSLTLRIPGGEMLTTSSKSRCFHGYWGKYFAYFMPTQSSGKGFLSGRLTVEDRDGTAYVHFELDTGQQNEDGSSVYKIYEGILVHSKSVDCVYCILSSAEVGELCFLMFRHFHLNRSRLECRVAEVLTAAAGGEDRYPTAHRMLISSQEIASEDVERLLPLLHLTNSKIIISQEELEKLGGRGMEYENIVQRILSNTELKPSPYYEIREDTIRTTVRDVRVGKLRDAVPLILKVRGQALAYRYNKVSKKTDESVRELLRQWGYYKSDKR